MTIRQENTAKMFFSIEDFLSANSEAVSKLPGFQDIFGEYTKTLANLRKSAERQSEIRTGIAGQKKEVKKGLVELLVETSSRLLALSNVTGDIKLKDEVGISPSAIIHMTDVSLRAFAVLLYDKAGERLAELEPYGVTSESQKTLLESINGFAAIMSKPRMGIAEKRSATRELAEFFDSADVILKKLDAVIGILRSEQSVFYNKYRTMRRIVSLGGGTIAMKVKVQDALTKEPVSGVIFTCKANGAAIQKRTARRGGFFIRNMKPGVYDFNIKKEGYRNQSVNVKVSQGERSDVSIALEKE